MTKPRCFSPATAQVEEATAGEIVMFSGITDIGIGETLVDPADPKPLPPIAVEEPTVKMTFAVNKSPLAGKEGDKLTSRLIRDRLVNECDRNVALRVEPLESGDAFEVGTADRSQRRRRRSRPLRDMLHCSVAGSIAFPSDPSRFHPKRWRRRHSHAR